MAKNERFSGFLNWPKCLVNIKQGFDHPVSVTAAITRPLVPFTGISNNM